MGKRLLAAATLVVATSVLAQGKDTRLIQMQGGMVGDHCGKYLEAERTRSNDWGLYLTWLQGYITAYNVYGKFPPSAAQRNLARGTDIADWSAWIKNYCQAHPLAYYVEAVDALMTEFGAENSHFRAQPSAPRGNHELPQDAPQPR